VTLRKRRAAERAVAFCGLLGLLLVGVLFVGAPARAAMPGSIIQAVLQLNGTPVYVNKATASSTPGTITVTAQEFYLVTCTAACQVGVGSVTSDTGIPLAADEKLYVWNAASTTIGHYAASGSPVVRVYRMSLTGS